MQIIAVGNSFLLVLCDPPVTSCEVAMHNQRFMLQTGFGLWLFFLPNRSTHRFHCCQVKETLTYGKVLNDQSLSRTYFHPCLFLSIKVTQFSSDDLLHMKVLKYSELLLCVIFPTVHAPEHSHWHVAFGIDVYAMFTCS
uniref:Secreted protein n=1 Tax=Schistocephalus solidus TaxID=70667 RepID=A0A0X3P5Z1_SCHSO